MSHPLVGDETVVEQPTLPLDFLEPDDDETRESTLDDTLFAEPRWREPGS